MIRLDTRLAVADALATARENMRQSAAKARQGTSRREIIERLLAATPPVPRALPAPAGVTIAPVAPALIDLTGVAPFTERALATTTGISLAQIAKAVTAKKIRVCRRRGGRRHHRSGRQDSHHRALCGHQRHGGGPIRYKRWRPVSPAPPQGEAILKDVVELADRYHIPIRTAIRAEIAPHLAIQHEARKGGYDLIVMGVSRRPGSALFFGKTASKTLAKAKVSMLLVSS